MGNDARDNLICHCGHSFREHVLKYVSARGTVGADCMMAGCHCKLFVLDDRGTNQSAMRFGPQLLAQRAGWILRYW